MQFIKGDSKTAAALLAARILRELIAGRRVLWLVCGGSNISISVEAENQIRSGAAKGELDRLCVTLTDERFGPVGHADSNWRQLAAAGFDFALVKSVPVLRGLSLDETVAGYESDFNKLADEADVVVAQFGIGSDGHIAGALPDSPGILSSRLALAYEAADFTRITLAPKALREIDAVFAFVFGESKRQVMRELRDKNLPFEKQPAQILKELPEAYLVSDQLP